MGGSAARLNQARKIQAKAKSSYSGRKT